MAKELETTYEEYANLSNFEVKRWPGWHAVLSTNRRGHRWTGTTRGWTPLNQRNDLRGIKLVETLAAEYGRVRGPLGRIFIDHTGAYFKIVEKQFQRFVIFKFI